MQLTEARDGACVVYLCSSGETNSRCPEEDQEEEEGEWRICILICCRLLDISIHLICYIQFQPLFISHNQDVVFPIFFGCRYCSCNVYSRCWTYPRLLMHIVFCLLSPVSYLSRPPYTECQPSCPPTSSATSRLFYIFEFPILLTHRSTITLPCSASR